MDTNVAAPSGEAAPSTNVEAPATAAPAEAMASAPAPEITAEQVAKYLNTSVDTLEKFNTFASNNGGFDKSFSKMKTAVTGRSEQGEAAPQAANPMVSQQPQPAATQAQPAPKITEGFNTPTEILVQMYNDRLESLTEYSPIREYIHKGGYIKDMLTMGMTPFDAQGNVNDRVIRQFLDMKAQTVPATPPSDPVTTTPTVEYYQTGDKIATQQEAAMVWKQSLELQRQGLAPHPKLEEAKAFLEQGYRASLPQKRGVKG